MLLGGTERSIFGTVFNLMAQSMETALDGGLKVYGAH